MNLQKSDTINFGIMSPTYFHNHIRLLVINNSIGRKTRLVVQVVCQMKMDSALP